jgi:hypothetical protein
MDVRNLSSMFKISTVNKITFKDKSTRTCYINRNIKYQSISILDDLEIETAEFCILYPDLHRSHNKNNSVDEDIMQQNYFMFLETGNMKYLRNFKYRRSVAAYSRSQLLNFVNKQNTRYNGNRTQVIKDRKIFANEIISVNYKDLMKRLFQLMLEELKSVRFVRF